MSFLSDALGWVRERFDRQTLTIVATILIILALPLSVFLAQQAQNLRQRASQSDVVRFTDANGIPLPQKVTDPNVYLWINLPNDWKIEESSSKNPLVREAYAQPACRAETTTCGQPTYGNCTFRCSGGRAFYDCVQTDNPNCQGTIECPANDSQCQQAPTPTPTQVVIPTQPPPATCKTNCGSCPTTTTCGVKTYDTCQDNLGQSGEGLCKNGATVFKCWASENTACSSDSGSGIFNYSCSACPVATTATPTIPPQITLPPTAAPTLISPTQPPSVHILKSLMIENKDTDGSSGGHEPFSISSSFSDYLNKPVYWKLNELKSDQTEAQRIVQVTLFDGTNYVPYVVTITLTRQISQTPTVTPPSSAGPNEFLVDIFVDNKLTLADHKALADWAKDTIDNYTSQKFQQAGIKHKLKVDGVYENVSLSGNTCPSGYQKEVGYAGCRLIKNDGKIRIWLYQKYSLPIGLWEQSHVLPSIATINMILDPLLGNFLNNDNYKRNYIGTLIHELGHIFTLPDYYLEDVSSDVNNYNNHVVKLGVESYIKDIMNRKSLEESGIYFSETSKEFINRVISIPAVPAGYSTDYFANTYTPRKTVLRITDDNSLSLNNIKIEVFQQEYANSNSPAVIPDKVKFSGFTDQNGQLDLGDWAKLFNISLNGRTALVRITKDNQIRYMAITRSYLNYLYFQGQTETATITKQFSSLVAYDPNKTTILSVGQRPVLSGDGGVTTSKSLSEEERKLLDEHLQQHLQEEQTGNNQQPTSSNPQPTLPPGSAQDETYNLILKCFGQSVANNPSCREADLTGDGVVDIFDYNKYVENFGKRAP